MKERVLPSDSHLFSGNVACVEGAIMAGCDFFSGYPITPSTEIAERMAERMPRVGGTFIQMEDELAAIGAVIGASWAGAKSMTATSGPGFSLMQEHIGFAITTETPCVIVDVQRGTPGTGVVAAPMQGDVFQTKWGHHGGCEIIALAPSTVQEVFEDMIAAFNLAEEFRTPVVVLSDALLGHLREKVVIPPASEIEIRSRKKPDEKPEECRPFLSEDGVAPMPLFGEGYNLLVTSTSHDVWGRTRRQRESALVTTVTPSSHRKLVQRLNNKILNAVDRITRIEALFMDDSEIAVISYGSAARGALSAVKTARDEGVKVGFVRLHTIWPFNDNYMKMILKDVNSIIVAELNTGQILREVQRIARSDQKMSFIYGICDLIPPSEIYMKIRECT